MEEDQAILQYPSLLLLFNEGNYQNKNFQGFSCSNNDFGEGGDIRNQTSFTSALEYTVTVSFTFFFLFN